MRCPKNTSISLHNYMYAYFMLYKKLEYAKIESRNQTDNIRETTWARIAPYRRVQRSRLVLLVPEGMGKKYLPGCEVIYV